MESISYTLFFSAKSTDKSRPFCECDRKLITALATLTPQYSHYDDTKCIPGKSNHVIYHHQKYQKKKNSKNFFQKY